MGDIQEGKDDTERTGTADSSQQKLKELHMRERAIARAEDLQETKVELAVNKKLEELDISNERINAAAKVYKKICGQYPAAVGKAVSKKERQDEELDDQSLVYGEIQFRTFALTIEKIRYLYDGLRDSGGIFVDIGSGTGKAVFAAMLMHDFDRVIGIEILNGLHEISRDIEAIWHEQKGKIDGLSARTKKTQIDLIRGDAFKVDWADATLAFVNSTCFDEKMMETVAEHANQMQTGSFLISFTRRLPSEEWQLLEYERHIMSWGDATVFIHQHK